MGLHNIFHQAVITSKQLCNGSMLILGFRKHWQLKLALLLIFMAAYPLLTLPDDLNNSLLLAIDVLTIIYMTVLGMLVLRKQNLAATTDVIEKC